jgi:dienelactone hydrolase
MRNQFAILVLLLACLPLFATDAVFDVPALTATPLNAKVLKTSEQDGIVTEEVMFHSEMDGEKSVDIFAFFCYPKGAKGLPAFVWNQSGLGRASTYFPELGAKRGYAALCIDNPMPGYRSTGGYPVTLALQGDPKQNGIYHVAVALLKAVSYLESRPEVDKTRIGMAGSSWGGFLTTLMAGVDPRLKAASAMFGCGSLQLGNGWWSVPKDTEEDRAYREHWRTTLDPAWRLPQSQVPMAWFTGTNDHFYWMHSVMSSFERAGGPKHLTLMPNYNHGLPPELDDQVFAWLDTHLQGKPPFIAVSPVSVVKRNAKLYARWTFTPVETRPITGAELILSYGENSNWEARHWQPLPARMNGTQCETELPLTALPYYISGTIIDRQQYRYSTPLLQVAPTMLVDNPRGALKYDGCAEWGDFEAPHLETQRRFGLRIPPISRDAHRGEQAAVIEGKVALFTINFTAGIPHRLTCYLKAKTPGKVTLSLKGTFDGKPLSTETTVDVGKRWTRATLDFLPPHAAMARLSMGVTAPDGAEVLLDSVTFTPLPKNK